MGWLVQFCWLECGLEQPMVDATYVDRSSMFHILDKLADKHQTMHGNTWGYILLSILLSCQVKECEMCLGLDW